MFPQKFYISKEQNELVHTTVVTTQVQDAVDLVRRSDPWVKIKENPLKEERQEKKVLIFADKFFSNRSPDNKEAIYGKLKKARRAGFKILIPSRNEGLVEWKGDEIADNFSSEISDFDLEKINTLALEQHQLSNKKICVLDYFSINEWVYTYNRGKNVILMSDFFEKHDLLIRLNEETQNPHYCISASKIDLLDAFLNKIPLPQFVETAENSVFLDALGGTVKYKSCRKITGFFSDLEGGRCQLKEVDLSSSDETGQSIAALLRAAPGIEVLSLQNCKNTAGAFLDLKENELAHLKEIDLSYSTATAQDIATLLRVVPGLERLILRGCKENIINVFYDFKEKALVHLKEIDLSFSVATEKDIAVILGVAPSLEILNLRDCEFIAGVFSDLEKNELTQLKEVNLNTSGVTSEDIVVLLAMAPRLETLHLVSCQNITGAFSDL